MAILDRADLEHSHHHNTIRQRWQRPMHKPGFLMWLRPLGSLKEPIYIKIIMFITHELVHLSKLNSRPHTGRLSDHAYVVSHHPLCYLVPVEGLLIVLVTLCCLLPYALLSA